MNLENLLENNKNFFYFFFLSWNVNFLVFLQKLWEEYGSGLSFVDAKNITLIETNHFVVVGMAKKFL